MPPTEHAVELPGFPPPKNIVELPGVDPRENKVDEDVVRPLLPIEYDSDNYSDDMDEDKDTSTQ